MGLECDVTYRDGEVTALRPVAFGAYNDCTIRTATPKISHKKNWGPASKGFSRTLIPIDRFGAGGVMDGWWIASFLRRDGRLHRYGLESPVLGYSYFYQPLLAWIMEKMNRQEEEGPLEAIPALLKTAGFPGHVLISIGSTGYTPYGESTFLKAGDEAIVVVYDGKRYDTGEIGIMAEENCWADEGISPLVQKVEAPSR